MALADTPPYIPNPPTIAPQTEDGRNIAAWVQKELTNISNNLGNQTRNQMTPISATPPTPREGLLAYADGINWNPESAGPGLRIYTQGVWKAISIIPFRLVRDFGAKGDNIANDTSALNTAFAFGANNNILIVLVGSLGNRFKITSTLFATPQGSNQKSARIIGVGRGFSVNQAQSIIDATAIVDKPAIVIQRGYGCYLSQFLVQGGNVAPQTFIGNYAPMLYGASWVTVGLRDSRYSPYCAISIDGGVGSTPPDGGYPGFTYVGSTAGSTDIVLNNIGAWGFVVGIMNNSESNVTQGDTIKIINPQIVYCKVGVASGQSQADANTVQDGNIAFCRTCFDGQEYGQRQGNPPLFINTQFGPGFEIYSFPGSFGMQQLLGCRSESVHRIGQVGIGATAASFPVVHNGSWLNVLNPDVYPQARCPIVLEATSSPIEWDGGALSDQSVGGADSFIIIGQPATLRGLLIGPMANRFRPFIGGTLDFQYPVELRNCRIYDTGGAIIYGNEARQLSLGNRFSAHWSAKEARDINNNLYHFQPGNGNNYINIGVQTAIVFTSTTLVFNNNDPAGFAVNDLIMWRFNTIGKSLVQHTGPAAKVTSIVGNVITCALLYPLVYYDQTYNIGTTSIVVNEWGTAPGQALTGNINGTTALSGVSPVNILQNGDWIASTGIPANTRVASGGGTAAITLSRAATITQNGVKLGYGGLIRLDADTIGADNGDNSVDLNPRQDACVQLWNTPLTAARTASLASFINFPTGSRFRIVRGAGATGAFNLNIGTGPVKALAAASQWCDVEYNGATGLWIETAAGTL